MCQTQGRVKMPGHMNHLHFMTSSGLANRYIQSHYEKAEITKHPELQIKADHDVLTCCLGCLHALASF